MEQLHSDIGNKWWVCLLLSPHAQIQSFFRGSTTLTLFFFIIRPDPEVIKLFSYSTQLSTKFQLLIKTKILTNKEVSCFKSLRCCIYHANKCLNANNC